LTGLFKNQIVQYASRLRFPKLLVVTLAVFLVDLFIPDVIPFVDEILLGLLAAILALLKGQGPRREGRDIQGGPGAKPPGEEP
jgi:hypothetical protein